MRHYCLGGCSAPSVCARRSRPVRGGSGRYLASCLFRFPLPAPRVPRCVWRAVLSGCPIPSLAGTPFHAVCAFRALGQVALPVVPACPFLVCALALSRCPLPPRWCGVRISRGPGKKWPVFGKNLCFLASAKQSKTSPPLFRRCWMQKKHVVWGHRSPKHNLQHANYLNGCFFLCCRFWDFWTS